MKTGEIIKKLRIEKGLTMEELGAKIGVQKAAIYKYENGLVVNLKRSTLEKLANALGVTPSYLMGYSDEVSPAQNDPTEAELNSIEFALWGEVKEMTEEQKEDVLKLILFLKEQGKL